MSLTERIFGRWGTSTTMANQPSTSLPTQPGATPSVMNVRHLFSSLNYSSFRTSASPSCSTTRRRSWETVE